MRTPSSEPDATTSYLPSMVNVFRAPRASGDTCISSRKISVEPGSACTPVTMPRPATMPSTVCSVENTLLAERSLERSTYSMLA